MNVLDVLSYYRNFGYIEYIYFVYYNDLRANINIYNKWKMFSLIPVKRQINTNNMLNK